MAKVCGDIAKVYTDIADIAAIVDIVDIANLFPPKKVCVSPLFPPVTQNGVILCVGSAGRLACRFALAIAIKYFYMFASHDALIFALMMMTNEKSLCMWWSI